MQTQHSRSRPSTRVTALHTTWSSTTRATTKAAGCPRDRGANWRRSKRASRPAATCATRRPFRPVPLRSWRTRRRRKLEVEVEVERARGHRQEWVVRIDRRASRRTTAQSARPVWRAEHNNRSDFRTLPTTLLTLSTDTRLTRSSPRRQCVCRWSSLRATRAPRTRGHVAHCT